MLKRGFDIIFAVMATILLAPVILLTAIAVKIFIGSPILFAQVRPGHLAKPFKMIKFRTMTAKRDVTGTLLPDKERLTRFGKFLRSSSLDELPELWNIFIGDMSVVGPRPLLLEYLPLYSKEQQKRHLVKPGLTGWAQIKGRNAISWSEKFAYDIWYVENQSFFLDMKIIVLTFKSVIARNGISAAEEATMPKFEGNTLNESAHHFRIGKQ